MNDWILVDQLDKNTTNQAFMLDQSITVPYVEGMQPGEIVYIYKKGTGEIKYKCMVEDVAEDYQGSRVMILSLIEEYPDGLINDFALEKKGFYSPAISMHAPSNMEDIINHIFENPVKRKSSRVKWAVMTGVLVASLACGSVLSAGVYHSLTRLRINNDYSERVIENIDNEVIVDGAGGEYAKQWLALFHSFEDSAGMDGISLFTQDRQESAMITVMYDKLAEQAGYDRDVFNETDAYYSDPDTNAFVVVTDFAGDNKGYDSRNIKWFASTDGEGIDESFYPSDFPARAGEDMDESLEKLGITKDMIKQLEKNDGYLSGQYNGEEFYVNTYSNKGERDFYISVGNKTLSLDYRNNMLDVIALWTNAE